MISVMTLNIGNGLTPPQRLVSWLRTSGVSIVGLQEVDARQAEVIARDLAGVFPYQVLHGTGFCGRGLISRYPIDDHDLVELRAGRTDLRVRLSVSNFVVTVIVAHPLPPKLQLRGIVADPHSGAHVDGLLDLALASSPAIMLGDFNMTPRNPLYDRLRAAGLVDAFDDAGSGLGLTFPVRPGKMRSINHRMHWFPLPPVSRIDYIWHTPEFRAVDAWVGSNVGSDHLPVMARLALRPPERFSANSQQVVPSVTP